LDSFDSGSGSGPPKAVNVNAAKPASVAITFMAGRCMRYKAPAGQAFFKKKAQFCAAPHPPPKGRFSKRRRTVQAKTRHILKS
jgi:hypothetical protein